MRIIFAVLDISRSSRSNRRGMVPPMSLPLQHGFSQISNHSAPRSTSRIRITNRHVQLATTDHQKFTANDRIRLAEIGPTYAVFWNRIEEIRTINISNILRNSGTAIDQCANNELYEKLTQVYPHLEATG